MTVRPKERIIATVFDTCSLLCMLARIRCTCARREGGGVGVCSATPSGPGGSVASVRGFLETPTAFRTPVSVTFAPADRVPRQHGEPGGRVGGGQLHWPSRLLRFPGRRRHPLPRRQLLPWRRQARPLSLWVRGCGVVSLKLSAAAVAARVLGY